MELMQTRSRRFLEKNEGHGRCNRTCLEEPLESSLEPMRPRTKDTFDAKELEEALKLAQARVEEDRQEEIEYDRPPVPPPFGTVDQSTWLDEARASLSDKWVLRINQRVLQGRRKISLKYSQKDTEALLWLHYLTCTSLPDAYCDDFSGSGSEAEFGGAHYFICKAMELLPEIAGTFWRYTIMHSDASFLVTILKAQSDGCRGKHTLAFKRPFFATAELDLVGERESSAFEASDKSEVLFLIEGAGVSTEDVSMYPTKDEYLIHRGVAEIQNVNEFGGILVVHVTFKTVSTVGRLVRCDAMTNPAKIVSM